MLRDLLLEPPTRTRQQERANDLIWEYRDLYASRFDYEDDRLPAERQERILFVLLKTDGSSNWSLNRNNSGRGICCM